MRDTSGSATYRNSSSPAMVQRMRAGLHTQCRPPPPARGHAATYPGQVAGTVLLDFQPPNAFTSLPGYPGFYSARSGSGVGAMAERA